MIQQKRSGWRRYKQRLRKGTKLICKYVLYILNIMDVYNIMNSICIIGLISCKDEKMTGIIQAKFKTIHGRFISRVQEG